MANTEKILRKLALYQKDPDIVQPLSNVDLADLVVVVLGQVNTIQKAINEKRLDGKTPVADVDYPSQTTIKKQALKAVQDALKGVDSKVDTKLTNLDKQVQESIQRLQSIKVKDGENGKVTDDEIERAAQIALSMIDLPDFDSLVSETITTDGGAIRDALELLSGDARYKVEIADVELLEEKLMELAQIRSSNGGTVGKQQVYSFIRQAVADGTIGAGGGVETLVAGTNVTIDDTDPANPIISAAVPGGSGDMAASVYDPTSVVGDAFDMDNMVEGTDTKILTSAERAAIAANTAKVSNATHTGDVTGDTALTIANDAVTFDKIQNIATNRVLARSSSGTGSVEDLTLPNFRSLINVEDGADVTDTANVTAAGALMDSEVTNLAQVKAFDSTDYATAAQGTKADNALPFTSGAGAPVSAPTVSPSVYLDTTNDAYYFATGTASVGDWSISLTGGVLPKGSILVSDGSSLIEVGIGTNTQVLTADSGETTGVKWAAPSGGSGNVTSSATAPSSPPTTNADQVHVNNENRVYYAFDNGTDLIWRFVETTAA